MFRVIALYGTPDDEQAFVHHYETVHAPLTREVPGLTAFTYGPSIRVPADGDEPPFFWSAVCEWESRAAWEEAMATPAGAAAGADLANFVTGGMQAVLVEPEGASSAQPT